VVLERRKVALAGLMHDLGKAMIPMEILNKPGKLSQVEFDIIKQHPREGHRLLLTGSDAAPVVLDVCLHHHEKTDGSGYPDKLLDGQISLYAKMGAVCDVYDAITSNRPYKPGWDPAESMRRMAEWARGTLIFRCSRLSSRVWAFTRLAAWCNSVLDGWVWWWRRHASP
jgi:HD-GYP domain-containing protein (c-di-GMP phosphodiesterase class II)